jgi:hypothetical protein
MSLKPTDEAAAKIEFSPPKVSGPIRICYYARESITIKTPYFRAPFGISSGRLYIESPVNDDVFEFIETVRQKAIDHIHQTQKVVHPATRDLIEDRFTAMSNGNHPYSARFKVSDETSIFLASPDGPTPATHMDVTRGCSVRISFVVNGIWMSGNRYGLQLKALQILVKPAVPAVPPPAVECIIEDSDSD